MKHGFPLPVPAMFLAASLCFCALTIISGAVAATSQAAEPFQTAASSAILMDADSGAILFEKNADAPTAPGSIAKIMSAEVVFHQLTDLHLHLDDIFIVSENAWRRGGAPSGGTAMFAAVNSRVRVEDLLRGLIVESGNDAAIALAEGISGSEDAFVAVMNQRARDLGLSGSRFSSSWGKEAPDEKMTVRDVAKLSIHVMSSYPNYYKYFGEREFTWNKVHQYNRNPLLAMNVGADGLKTGESNESGFSLAGSAMQNGERLVLVVTGLKTARERAAEAAKLLAWGYRAFEVKNFYTSDEVIGTASVYGGAAEAVPLVAAQPIRLMVPRGAAEPLTGKITYEGPLRAPVQKGDVVAHLKLFRGGTQILDVPLRTADAVGTGTLAHRAFDATMELATMLLRKYVFPH